MLTMAKRAQPNKALVSERIQKLIKALSNGVYEREETIKLCLLAALAGESVFLLGPPGIAKSLIAKRLIQAFDNSQFFDYLMTRFSTPEEVFGPLSIQELKDNGKYVRLVDGYLPTAQVVFLDEIWKAGPAILNTLLTVVNERTFKNGQDVLPVPMRLLVTASNELPEEDSGLEALYDRMLVRVFVNRIQEKQNFKAMLMGEGPSIQELEPGLAITDEEYDDWQAHIEDIKLSEDIFEKIYQLKTMIEQRAEGVEHIDEHESELYISDRRWKKSVRLLKASAFYNGRDAINPLDLLLLQDCMWHSPESRNVIRNIVSDFAIEKAFNQESAQISATDAQTIIDDVNSEVASELAVTLSRETMMRKEWFKCDLSGAKRYTVNHNSRMIKLVMLQQNPSVSEQEKGDGRWVYVDGDDFEKKIKTGQCDIYGFVNKNAHLCRLQFEVDAQQRLVIKDIANRSVLVGIAGEGGISQAQQAHWVAMAEKASSKVLDAEHSLKMSRSSFHGALPHNFIDPQLPERIEQSLSQATDSVHDLKITVDKNVFRISHLTEYFA
ncbi:ATPase RavA domain-containing protein [Photobacterium rosenbergii]|uniref:ATPase RavA domain-containing protein n=1 Tax=Photobacterium rosenbergii TaxID=294936 RepID=A0ABU3ZBR5_9GAMM|nr:ATPase RavA domain-containing protein [Photobacterium rosenbergii]MDV5167562.1 ATPase RavA domain-containing protein [Photobacterium rosenbergii]